MEKIQLRWRGPFELERLPEVCQDWGIYAVCRTWGNTGEKVLYIGKAYCQDIPKRLRQHKWWLDELKGNLKIRFASIELGEGSRQSDKRTTDIEALLIYCCQPAYNIQNKNSYRGRLLEIVNTGRHGPIGRVIQSVDL